MHTTALEQNGLKIMLLLRLSPLIPFNALDYISGVTSISFRDYALALIGILPGTIMFCMVGATASSLADTGTSSENMLARRVSLIGGLLFAVIGVAVASYYSKMELDKVGCIVLHCVSDWKAAPECLTRIGLQIVNGTNGHYLQVDSVDEAVFRSGVGNETSRTGTVI
jgi:SNARE associated Golgi protein